MAAMMSFHTLLFVKLMSIVSSHQAKLFFFLSFCHFLSSN